MNETTLPDVEEISQRVSQDILRWLGGHVSDSTLDRVIREVDTESLSEQLVEQIRQMNRKKMLEPVGLLCGIVTMDGKNLATLSHYANDTDQKRHGENGSPYWLALALRATLTY